MSTSIIFIHFGRYCHLIHCQKYACQQVIEIQIFDYGDEQMPKVAPCSKMPVPKSLLSMPYAIGPVARYIPKIFCWQNGRRVGTCRSINCVPLPSLWPVTSGIGIRSWHTRKTGLPMGYLEP